MLGRNRNVKKEKVSSAKTAAEAPLPEDEAAVSAPVPEIENGVNKVGSLLRQMRQQKSLKIKDIAKKLCIRSAYLEAIEESHYDELPDFPYRLGFIRSYAEFLGLNSSNIVELYKEETDKSREKNIYVLEPQSEATVPGKKYLLLSLLSIVLIYALWSFYNNRYAAIEENPLPAATAVEDEAGSNLPLVVEEFSSVQPETQSLEPLPVIEVEPSRDESNPQVVVTNSSFPGMAPAAEPIAEVQPIAEPLPVAPVVLKIKKEVWIEVKDGSKLYISKVLQPGETYTVPEGSGMILSVGRVDAVDVLVYGKVTPVVSAAKKTNISLDKFLNAANH